MSAQPARVFVVGCPRSGTTFVQSLLAAHSKVVTFTESHLFDKALLPVGPLTFVRPNRLRQFAAKFVQENPHLPPDAGSRLIACGQLRQPAEVVRRTVAILDEAAVARGASHWVEKTPDHVFRIPLIRSVVPDARFIHVIRPARNVLPSLYRASRQWGRNKSWLSCSLHWDVAVWLSVVHARGPRHFVVLYDDLIRAREQRARAMMEWLGLEWEGRVLEDFGAAAARCIAEDETWKAANRQASPRSDSQPAAALPVPWFARAVARFGPYELLRRRASYA